jgi:hypothetical protein
MRTAFFLGMVLALCGCKTVDRNRTVRLESSPPGARIYYGEGYSRDKAHRARRFVGQTPCSMTILGDEDGRFDFQGVAFYSSLAVEPFALFEAEAGTNVLQNAFRGGAIGRPADRIPDAVFFDFSKHAPAATASGK